MRKRLSTKTKTSLAKRATRIPLTPSVSAVLTGSESELLYAAKLQRRLGISDVTLWRWRNNERMGFPKGRRINRRVYFPWHEVAAWLDRQQQVA
jgi:predicted DNA-binding transcriptional regulator AlpA